MTLNLMLIFSKETINNERQYGQNCIEHEGLIVVFSSAKFHSNSFKALLFVFCLLLTCFCLLDSSIKSDKDAEIKLRMARFRIS